MSLGPHAPSGTPREIVAQLAPEVARFARDPDVRRHFAEQATELFSTTPEDFAAVATADIAKWRKVIREAGIKME